MHRLGSVAWLFLTLAVLLTVLLGTFLVTGRVPGLADCTVELADQGVDLDTVQAEQAASTAADVLRRTQPPRRAFTPVVGALETDEHWNRRDARVLARSLTGRAPASLSCRHGGGEEAEPDRLNERGLTNRAERVRRDLSAAFGSQQYGGFAPGGISSGHQPGSAHYAGRALDIFFRPINARNRERGWALAHYLVANAERLDLDTVIFDARIWTTRRADEGWRDYTPDTTGRSRWVARVLEHRDHVHVDVAD